MKILVIATGGTIGSGFDGASIDVQGGCAVAGRYVQEHKDVDIEVVEPLNILSESITANDLNTLAAAIYNSDTEKYDGEIQKFISEAFDNGNMNIKNIKEGIAP